MLKKSFVQGMVPQAGAALAPQGQQLHAADVARVVLAYLNCRSRIMRAAFSTVLRSEAFSIAAGFVSAVVMLFSIWSLLWIVSIMMEG
ncbi:MAG: hypothetical protein E7100_02930 [Bacteroidaceae bacterium]|jgi:hypothetical protein|nr:hypothetical protein [Bacteroidaceae bacterium]